MKIYTFVSQKDGKLVGFTMDRNGANLPREFGPWPSQSSAEQDVFPGDGQRIGPHTDELLAGLQKRGFYLYEPSIVVARTPIIPGSSQDPFRTR